MDFVACPKSSLLFPIKKKKQKNLRFGPLEQALGLLWRWFVLRPPTRSRATWCAIEEMKNDGKETGPHPHISLLRMARGKLT